MVVGLRLTRVIIVGHSMGGMVAQHLARLHEGLIGGLVLSGVDWGSRQYGKASTLLYPVFMTATLRMVRLQACLLRAPLALTRRLGSRKRRGRERGPISTAAGEFSGHNPGAIGGAAREITLFRSIDWLHEIKVPTTVLVTLRDSLFPPAEQRRMAQEIAAARVHEYDGGHVSARLPEYASARVSACLDVSSRMAEGKAR